MYEVEKVISRKSHGWELNVKVERAGEEKRKMEMTNGKLVDFLS